MVLVVDVSCIRNYLLYDSESLESVVAESGLAVAFALKVFPKITKGHSGSKLTFLYKQLYFR